MNSYTYRWKNHYRLQKPKYNQISDFLFKVAGISSAFMISLITDPYLYDGRSMFLILKFFFMLNIIISSLVLLNYCVLFLHVTIYSIFDFQSKRAPIPVNILNALKKAKNYVDLNHCQDNLLQEKFKKLYTTYDITSDIQQNDDTSKTFNCPILQEDINKKAVADDEKKAAFTINKGVPCFYDSQTILASFNINDRDPITRQKLVKGKNYFEYEHKSIVIPELLECANTVINKVVIDNAAKSNFVLAI